jgi:hypothetical protein
MSRHRTLLLFLTVLLAGTSPALATISYQVTVNTSSLSGTAGFLDFEFNPGGVSQSGFATVSNFVPSGALSNSPSITGNVTGTLPPAITITNSGAFNDFFVGFNYGASLSFLLTLGGPAIDSPNGTSISGSTFGFGMFASDGFTPELTSNADGFGFLVDVNLNGSTTVSNFITSTNSIQVVVPEPGSIALTLLGLAGILYRAGARTRTEKHSN